MKQAHDLFGDVESFVQTADLSPDDFNKYLTTTAKKSAHGRACYNCW